MPSVGTEGCEPTTPLAPRTLGLLFAEVWRLGIWFVAGRGYPPLDGAVVAQVVTHQTPGAVQARSRVRWQGPNGSSPASPNPRIKRGRKVRGPRLLSFVAAVA